MEEQQKNTTPNPENLGLISQFRNLIKNSLQLLKTKTLTTTKYELAY